MLSSLAPTTIRMRKVQWRAYLRFCLKFGLQPCPCSNDQLSLFASFMSQYMTYASVSNYLQSVLLVHKLLGINPPSVSSYIVKLTLSGIRRHSPPSVGKDPITIRHLKLMFFKLDLSSRNNVMFWACLLLLFRSLLRISHVVTSKHMLRRGDVSFPSGGGMLVTTRSSKTVRPGSQHVIPIANLKDKRLCAVYWMKKWLSLYNPPPTAPLFALCNCQLSYSRFSKALSHVITSSGIRGNIASHSFCRGGATFLASIGMPVEFIKERGAWTSDSVYKYICEPLVVKVKRECKVANIIDVACHSSGFGGVA